MSVLQAVQQLKHRLFVMQKHCRWALRDAMLWVNDRRWAYMEERQPFQYLSAHYPHTFLSQPTPAVDSPRAVPRQIFVLWFGSKAMNYRRSQSLASIKAANPQIPVEIVTESSVQRWMTQDAPFHPAYEHLSAVHKSDYVRCYLMHHYGGGYCDVKPIHATWSGAFDDLDLDGGILAVGYREVTSRYTPDLPRNLGADLKRHYRAVFGPSAFIFRPGTELTTEWMRELHARMDYYAAALIQSSGADSYAPHPSYPIRWTEILGDIVQPLTLKYQDKIIFDDRIRPQLKDYR